MSAAVTKKPAGRAGFNHEIANKSSYNNNLSQLYRRVNELCRRWQMSRTDFDNAACVYALVFRNSAPRETQFLYTGRPSLYSEHGKQLALAFFIAYVNASERIMPLNKAEPVDAGACWAIATAMVGGA